MNEPTITELGIHRIIRYPQTWTQQRCQEYATVQGWPLVEMIQLPLTELPWYGHILGNKKENH